MNNKPDGLYSSPLLGVVAPMAGWSPPIRYLLRRARILACLHDMPRGSLVEVGCGAGALLCDLSSMGFRASGVETSPDAIAIGRELAILTGSQHSILPTPSPEWERNTDMVCAFDVLEHIEDDEAAIQEWASWLAPAGKLLISVPAHQHRWGAGDEWAGHWRRYGRADLIRILEQQGLKVLHIECYGFPLANITEWLGNHAYRKMIRSRGNVLKSEATAHSGTERSTYTRLSRLVTALPARMALRAAMALQHISRHTDLGSGYLVLADRK